jgi:S-adenosylmethionine-diacylglycerol 3-amino-3-carboxypropyl transferase
MPSSDTLRSPAAEALKARLSYAQVWEDAAILQAALQVGPDDDVLSIASAGDNSFALAIAGARSVTCIDLSFPQLALTELKLAATSLEYDEFIRLLGATAEKNRRGLLQKIHHELSPDVRLYWQQNIDLIDAGVIGQGKFERYLDAFRTRLLPLIHSRGALEKLSELQTLEAQRRFFDERWNNRRYRGLFRLFFSRFVMERTGRTAAHFAHVEGAVSSEFLRRTKHVLTNIPIVTNPYLQWMLRGRYRDVERAHLYLTRDGHRKLREVRPRIRLVLQELEQHLPSVIDEKTGAGRYSAFNYSNLFEYVSAEQHEQLLRLTVAAARKGARIAYWNLLVPRSAPASMEHLLERRVGEAQALLARDRAFVYGGFNLEIVR